MQPFPLFLLIILPQCQISCNFISKYLSIHLENLKKLFLYITMVPVEVAYLKDLSSTISRERSLGYVLGWHKFILDWLSFFDRISCQGNDTKWYCISELNRGIWQGLLNLWMRWRYTNWIPIFYWNNGFLFNWRKFLFLALSFLIFLPMTLKKIQKVYSFLLWIKESLTKYYFLSGG